MTQHTPGPWEVVAWGKPNTAQPAVIYNSNRHLRIVVDHGYDFQSPDPDACLIAAAPELLEMLGSMVEEYDGAGCEHIKGECPLYEARALLAKIEGKE